MKGPLIYIVSDRFDVFDFRFRSITPLLLVSGEIVEYTTRIACPIGFFTIYHLCFLQVARIDGYALSSVSRHFSLTDPAPFSFLFRSKLAGCKAAHLEREPE